MMGLRSAFALVLALPPLFGCAMSESHLYNEANSAACVGSLGSYYLPRSKVQVKVQSVPDPNAPVGSNSRVYQLKVDGIHREADPKRLYCLNYLQAATSDDLIRVWRDGEGLLTKVSSDANDQSHEILKTAVKTIFTALAGGPFDPNLSGARAGISGTDGTATVAVDVFNAKFDPTDPEEAAFVNDHLREFGFCLFAAAENAKSSVDPDTYCQNPQAHKELVSGGVDRAAPMGASFALPPEGGLVYRPRLPHRLFLFERQFLNDPAPSSHICRRNKIWCGTRSKVIWIENQSPPVVVQVDRTFFAQQTSTVLFTDGVLKDVQVRKDSEVSNFIEVPLLIVQSVVALPTNIIQIQIDQTRGQKALFGAETKLLNAQQALYRRRLADKPTDTGELLGFARGEQNNFPALPSQ